MRKFEREYDIVSSTELVKSERAFRRDVDLRLDVIEQRGDLIDAEAREVVDRAIRYIQQELSPKAAEIEQLLAGFRLGVPAAGVVEEPENQGRYFMTPTRRAALIADAIASGDAAALIAAAVAPLAPKSSPAFTDTPTAPTAPAGTSSNQIATTHFVVDAIAAAVAALAETAPAVLDTLGEIATAIANDPNFAATMADALGKRLRFDAAQALTAAQKTQAHDNLGLPAAARTGSYGDLINKPTIPAPGQPIPSAGPSTWAVGMMVWAWFSGRVGTTLVNQLNDGVAVGGSSLKIITSWNYNADNPYYSAWNTGSVDLAGTWKHVSGESIYGGYAGYFVRVA